MCKRLAELSTSPVKEKLEKEKRKMEFNFFFLGEKKGFLLIIPSRLLPGVDWEGKRVDLGSATTIIYTGARSLSFRIS